MPVKRARPQASPTEAFATKGTVMHAHHLMAVAAMILVGVGVNLTFFTAPTVEADSLSTKGVGVDVSQLHQSPKNPRLAARLRAAFEASRVRHCWRVAHQRLAAID